MFCLPQRQSSVYTQDIPIGCVLVLLFLRNFLVQ